MDMSGVLKGLSVAAVYLAIVGAGALMAFPDFARWAVDKVSGFFTDREDEDDDADDEYSGHYFDMPAEECEALGHVWEGGRCAFCCTANRDDGEEDEDEDEDD